jgi:hypothetical protein
MAIIRLFRQVKLWKLRLTCFFTKIRYFIRQNNQRKPIIPVKYLYINP